VIENLLASAIGVALWPLAATIGFIIPRLVPGDIMDVIEEHFERVTSTEDLVA
jgi:hypothetical protein